VWDSRDTRAEEPHRGTAHPNVKDRTVADELRLYTLREAARRLSLSLSTIQRLVARGELTSLKIGRTRRISQQALDNFVTRLEREYRHDPFAGAR